MLEHNNSILTSSYRYILSSDAICCQTLVKRGFARSSCKLCKLMLMTSNIGYAAGDISKDFLSTTGMQNHLKLEKIININSENILLLYKEKSKLIKNKFQDIVKYMSGVNTF